MYYDNYFEPFASPFSAINESDYNYEEYQFPDFDGSNHIVNCDFKKRTTFLKNYYKKIKIEILFADHLSENSSRIRKRLIYKESSSRIVNSRGAIGFKRSMIPTYIQVYCRNYSNKNIKRIYYSLYENKHDYLHTIFCTDVKEIDGIFTLIIIEDYFGKIINTRYLNIRIHRIEYDDGSVVDKIPYAIESAE